MNTKTNKKSVENLIFKMLSTSTGKALCDSGGENGRNWQRNQGKTLQDWKKSPSVTWDKDGQYHTISIFHYLVNGLDIDGLCKDFNRKPVKDWESDIYGVSASGLEWILDHGFKVDRSFNSYNGESALSQVIQGTWLYLGERAYLLLQIHQGADVRGGYTDAKLFYVPDYEDGALSEDVYGTIEKEDGTQISVDSRYNGTSLTTEDGESVEIGQNDKVSLSLMEY